jgi:hypothetical protein
MNIVAFVISAVGVQKIKYIRINIQHSINYGNTFDELRYDLIKQSILNQQGLYIKYE